MLINIYIVVCIFINIYMNAMLESLIIRNGGSATFSKSLIKFKTVLL